MQVNWVFSRGGLQQAIEADGRGVPAIAAAAGAPHSTLYRYLRGTTNIRADLLWKVWRELLK